MCKRYCGFYACGCPSSFWEDLRNCKAALERRENALYHGARFDLKDPRHYACENWHMNPQIIPDRWGPGGQCPKYPLCGGPADSEYYRMQKPDGL